MAKKRMVLEIGMGTDIRGGDPTKAACRALRDALWHNSLSIATALGHPLEAMMVDVHIGVPRPEMVDKTQVLAVLQRLRPSTDLTVGLYSSDEGAVTAGVYLPDLPPTMHAIVSGDTSNGAQAPVKYRAAQHQAHPLGYIVDGALKIDLEIKPQI